MIEIRRMLCLPYGRERGPLLAAHRRAPWHLHCFSANRLRNSFLSRKGELKGWVAVEHVGRPDNCFLAVGFDQFLPRPAHRLTHLEPLRKKRIKSFGEVA